jgi:hypothetical protein
VYALLILSLELWKTCHIRGSHQAALDANARRQLGSGICHVLSPLSDVVRLKSFENLLSFPQNELERLVQLADSTVEERDKTKYLEKVSGEIVLIASLCWCFTNSATSDDSFMESGCPSSPENRELVNPSVLSIVRRSWPKIAQVASTYVYNAVSQVCLVFRLKCSLWIYSCFFLCVFFTAERGKVSVYLSHRSIASNGKG